MSNEGGYIDLTNITKEQLQQLHDNFINCGKALSKPVSVFITDEIKNFNLDDLDDVMTIQNLINDIRFHSHQLTDLYNAITKVAVIKTLEKDKNFKFN